MASTGQRQAERARASTSRAKRRPHTDESGVIPVLARVSREVEAAAQRGPVKAGNRTRFQVATVLLREERARVKADPELSDAERAEAQRRLDGLAAILAKTAARDTSLISLLQGDAPMSAAARELRRDLLLAAGIELSPDDLIVTTETEQPDPQEQKQVVPQSVKQYRLANPFLAPDFEAYKQHAPKPQSSRLANWELIEPLFRAFEHGAGGGAASMELPERASLDTPGELQLMRHQARFVESARRGHRTYLLADEPGLGKTAQALLAASESESYPLLVVTPNVVKTNWAREVELWTPHRQATVVHGDGEDIDAFADVVIVNYEVLDRHVSWLSKRGFRGMVVDEAHFIKNPQSQRSQNVQSLAKSIRALHPNALMVALTGTPLINQIEDFRMIWQFLGWIDEKRPTAALMAKLDETGLTPADPGFFAAARQAVIDMGIVRRKKVDVAADIPARRIADIPVELDDEFARSIRESERILVARLVERYRALELRARSMSGLRSDGGADGGSGRSGPGDLDQNLIRMVVQAELEESKGAQSGDNVFTMVRRIGQAKAPLAADYTVNLARNVGKVVFFAKHIDVMDQAEAHFAAAGLRTISIRGDQTSKFRQTQIDAFANDPEVSIAVCSLTAAGVGVNLQAASNVVLAELSWTDAEQTQAIDRVHRIGQELPVTAWRILAAQTIDVKIADLVGTKAGLAARALDGSDVEVSTETHVQFEALVSLLEEALTATS